MKILVTGGAGFIASHIVDRYVELGHDVWVVDNLSSGKSEQIHPQARLVQADIRDSSVADWICRERPEVINHHAAQISVKVSTEDPQLDAEVNIAGLLNVLQAAVQARTRKFIFASSGGTIYGDPESPPVPETVPFAPLSPYGISKAAGEYYLRYYAADHDLAFTSLRYGNVYGPRQDPHGEAGVVAIFCRQLLGGEVPTIHWDGEQEKDMVYVGDVVRANVIALQQGDNQAFNIGTGLGTSVNHIFSALVNILGVRVTPRYGPKRPGDIRVSYLDTTRAFRELNWKAEVDLTTGLKHTLEFFRQQMDRDALPLRPA